MKEFNRVIKKHMFDLISEFKKCKSKKKYMELLAIFYVLDEIITNLELNIKYPKELDYEINKYNTIDYDKAYDILFNDNLDKMYDYNLEFSNIYKLLDYSILNKKYCCRDTIKIDESIRFSQEFFKQFDNNLYSYFNDYILNKGLLMINNKFNGARTYMANYVMPPYSFIRPELNISDFIMIVHETTHNYIRNRLRYLSVDDTNRLLVNNLEEVYPIFIELCSYKFLKDNNYLRDISIYKKSLDQALIKYLISFNKNLINMDINDYKSNESYSYGIVLAYLFFDNYLNDPQKTKENVLNLTLDSVKYDKEYLLNNYGLNQIDILNPHKLNKVLKMD